MSVATGINFSLLRRLYITSTSLYKDSSGSYFPTDGSYIRVSKNGNGILRLWENTSDGRRKEYEIMSYSAKVRTENVDSNTREKRSEWKTVSDEDLTHLIDVMNGHEWELRPHSRR